MIDITNYHTIPDLTGRRFGHFSVLRFHGESGHRGNMWHCQCQPCGRHILIHQLSLSKGHAILCKECQEGQLSGLMLIDEPTYHEFAPINRSQSEIKQFYDAMTQRSDRVCTRWRNSFDAFAKAMGDPPPNSCLIVKPKLLEYKTANCEWESRTAAFKFPRNRYLFLNGRCDTVHGWAKRIRQLDTCLFNRLGRSMSDEEVLTPFRLRRNQHV